MIIEIGGYAYDADVVFIEHLPRLGLFGMNGFFDRFACLLDRPKEIIGLSFGVEKGRVLGDGKYEAGRARK